MSEIVFDVIILTAFLGVLVKSAIFTIERIIKFSKIKGIAVTAIVSITSFVKKGFVVVSEEIHRRLDLKCGEVVNVDVAAFPESVPA